jgi:hypothetical protein
LTTPLLVLVFAAGAVAIWVAGVALSKATSALDARLGLGEELGAIAIFALRVAGLFVLPHKEERSPVQAFL